jgi:hypothetical protein
MGDLWKQDRPGKEMQAVCDACERCDGVTKMRQAFWGYFVTWGKLSMGTDNSKGATEPNVARA